MTFLFCLCFMLSIIDKLVCVDSTITCSFDETRSSVLRSLWCMIADKTVTPVKSRNTGAYKTTPYSIVRGRFTSHSSKRLLFLSDPFGFPAYHRPNALISVIAILYGVYACSFVYLRLLNNFHHIFNSTLCYHMYMPVAVFEFCFIVQLLQA